MRQPMSPSRRASSWFPPALYGLVRHPMYTGNVVLMLGIPLALGSYWGLLLFIPGLLVLDPAHPR